jgi:GH25 family lysozyme M1 (1,4-beta-N-acetylmuramidase)
MDAVDQADLFHQTVRRAGHFQLGDAAMLDLEVSDELRPMDVLNAAACWVLRVRETVKPQGLPIQVLVYTFPDFWLHALMDPKNAVLAACPLVMASYGSPPPYTKNWGWPAFWQYSTAAGVPGVAGPCDHDRFYGDRAALARIWGSPG